MTWTIPESYGGMTSALLHRSRALVRLGGAAVDVLTFDPKLDSVQTERRLRESGELVDGMRLLNVYDWFRTNAIRPDADGGLDLARHPFTPLEVRHEGPMRVRTAADGTVLQVDHYRADGSLMLSDRRDVQERGLLGGRSVVLCDDAGEPVRSWGGIWGFYRFWLDELRRREPSFFIVDSKTMAPFAMTYRRKRAVMLHVLHASHLAGDDPHGPLRESRRAVVEDLAAFDSVVVLTHRQRDDIVARAGAANNLVVIPNSRDLPPVPRQESRAVGRGVVLASLTARKRVQDAVQAVAQASVAASGLTLDIFGDGEERGRLEQLAAGITPVVSFHGHIPEARRSLGAYSFLLLTATSEGFPLVLLEAMALGCIPISYDMPYGPGDVIRHRRSGFLVQPGDVDGLSSAIDELARMSPRRVAAMRRAAVRAAQRFSDLEVTRVWAREQRRAEQRKLAAWPQRLSA